MNKEKTLDWNRIKYFRRNEFACSCCGEIVVDEKLVLMLDLARELADVPFVITSGYRCPLHNEEVGGVKNSSHMLGLAVDISVPDNVTRLKVIKGLIIAGFRRIGIGKNFIHCDIDTSKTNNLWLYKDK